MKNSEKGLRAELLQHWGSRCVRIEPAAGSTPGLPDVLMALGGGLLVLLELKSTRGRLRPLQLRVAEWAQQHSLPYMVLRPGTLSAYRGNGAWQHEPTTMADLLTTARDLTRIYHAWRTT